MDADPLIMPGRRAPVDATALCRAAAELLVARDPAALAAALCSALRALGAEAVAVGLSAGDTIARVAAACVGEAPPAGPPLPLSALGPATPRAREASAPLAAWSGLSLGASGAVLVPLVAEDGHAAGALLVAGPPRGTGDASLAPVEHLAAVAAARLVALEARAEADARAAELRTVFDTIEDPLVVFDRDGRPVRRNVAACSALGANLVPESEGALAEVDIRRPDGRRARLADLAPARALRGERVLREPLHVTTADERVLRILASAAPLVRDGAVAGAVATWEDVTEREHLFAILARARDDLERTVSERTAELTRLNRALSVLGAVSQAVLRASDEQALLADVCRIAVVEGGYRLAWVGYPRDDPGQTVRPAAIAGDASGYVASARLTWADVPRGQGPVGRAIRSGEVQVEAHLRHDRRAAAWRAAALRYGLEGAIALPIRLLGGADGVLALYARDPDAFGQDEVALLERVAADLAFGIGALRERALRHALEAGLRERERRFRAIFATMSQHMGLLAPDGTVLELNAAALAFEDTCMAAAEGRPVWDLRSWRAAPGERRRLKAALARVAEGESLRYEVATRDPAGRPVSLDFSLRPVRDDLGRVVLILPESQDITELRQLQREVLDAGEAERRRIGQDLHDSLGQLLTGTGFLAEVLERTLRARGASEAQSAGEVAQNLARSVSHTRALARGLCPVEVNADGLMMALEEFVRQAETLYGVSCTLACRKPVLIGDGTLATNLYQIACEAVNNAAKHGRATRVRITLSARRDAVCLTVDDDGTGLPEPARRGSGMGLRIMEHRARTVGGSLDVHPGRGGGTVVRCLVRTPRARRPV